MSEVDPYDYRRIIGRFATGVTVITTRADGIDHAMTANAVTSVSLDPVLMLISVEREARFHDAVLDSGIWGVSILQAAARPVAAWLSTRGRPLHGQLDRVPHSRGPATGVALVDQALAHLECRTVDTHPAGDHTLVIGHVISMTSLDQEGDALVYYRGQFAQLP